HTRIGSVTWRRSDAQAPCTLREQETEESAPAPPVRPDPMPPTHRHPHEVDPSRHFCPHLTCDSGGWLGPSARRRTLSMHPQEALLIALREARRPAEGRKALRQRTAVEHALT